MTLTEAQSNKIRITNLELLLELEVNENIRLRKLLEENGIDSTNPDTGL